MIKNEAIYLNKGYNSFYIQYYCTGCWMYIGRDSYRHIADNEGFLRSDIVADHRITIT
jgi:hypothetical protein